MAWSDDADSSLMGKKVINDLGLSVHFPNTGSIEWPEDYWGNNFHENRSGIDTGYSRAWTTPVDPDDWWVPDDWNNVEAVFVPASGHHEEVVITVTGSSVDSTGVPEQDFALYAYNVEYEASP